MLIGSWGRWARRDGWGELMERDGIWFNSRRGIGIERSLCDKAG